MTTLHEITDAALAAFPGLAYKEARDGFASRAHAAAHLVTTDAVTYIGAMGNGYDYWQVGDYACSVRGGYCQCQDHSAPMHQGGKLCKHRLAAMFRIKLERSVGDRLSQLLAAAPDDNVTLKIEVIYTNDGRIYKLAGHHYPGQPWVRHERDDNLEFGVVAFDQTLRRAGWSLAGAPVRQPARLYHYFLVRGLDGDGRLNDMAAQDSARIEQAARLREVEQTLEMLTEMETQSA